MADSDITPEHGITIYKDDFTQGPVCAMACPYGTLYRNYFSMFNFNPQTENYQINTLDELPEYILERLTYKNGYTWPKSDNDLEI